MPPSGPHYEPGGAVIVLIESRHPISLDLDDPIRTALDVFEFIRAYGGHENSLEDHILNVFDTTTGQPVAVLKPLLIELYLARAGRIPGRDIPTREGPFALAGVSDRALVAELARRLAKREVRGL